MKNNGKLLKTSFMAMALGAAASANAAVLNISDFSLTPDGTGTVDFEDTNVNTLNGGVVLPTSSVNVVYFVTTFTFGTDSDAHLEAGFRHSNLAPRVGVTVNDEGLVEFVGTADGTQTNFDLAQDMAGQTVVLLAKLHYDPDNNLTYSPPVRGGSDNTLMNVWVNPTNSSVEGSGLSAGDMSTLWNSAGFTFFRHTIQNQNTPSSAGTSSITDTVILTGADATFDNALLAAGIPEPSSALLAGIGALVLLRRRRA